MILVLLLQALVFFSKKYYNISYFLLYQTIFGAFNKPTNLNSIIISPVGMP